MKDLKQRGKAALAALSDGHVTPQNVELITNYIAATLETETSIPDPVALTAEYNKGFQEGAKEYAIANAELKQSLLDLEASVKDLSKATGVDPTKNKSTSTNTANSKTTETVKKK